MSEADVIERELRRQYPRPSAATTARARTAVMETATEQLRPEQTVAHRRWWPMLIAAVVVLAFAGTGVAIANSLGAFSGGVFNGMHAARHPRTADDVIDPATRAYMERTNCKQPDGRACAPMMVGIRFGTSRHIAQLPGGQNLYVFKTSWRGLCYVVGPQPHGQFNCSRPLSRSHPSTAWFYSNRPHISDWFTFGIALDGVTAVSFDSNGQEVTVPVKDNTWTYRGGSVEDNMQVQTLPLTAHFADGRTVTDKCTQSLSREELRLLGVPKSQLARLEGRCGR